MHEQKGFNIPKIEERQKERENAPPSERDLKPHKDKGLKISEQDLQELR